MYLVRSCLLALVALFLVSILLLSGIHAVVSKVQEVQQARDQITVSENYREMARYQAETAGETTKQVEFIQSQETVRFLAHEEGETDRLRIVTDAAVTMRRDDNQTTRDTSLVWLSHKIVDWGGKLLIVLIVIAIGLHVAERKLLTGSQND